MVPPHFEHFGSAPMKKPLECLGDLAAAEFVFGRFCLSPVGGTARPNAQAADNRRESNCKLCLRACHDCCPEMSRFFAWRSSFRRPIDWASFLMRPHRTG
jgi:hypothetical protein